MRPYLGGNQYSSAVVRYFPPQVVYKFGYPNMLCLIGFPALCVLVCGFECESSNCKTIHMAPNYTF